MHTLGLFEPAFAYGNGSRPTDVADAEVLCGVFFRDSATARELLVGKTHTTSHLLHV
jgi:hypothetical protein